MSEVLAAYGWRDNAALIADVAKLGYLEGSVLDVTYGKGTFWKRWKPETLVTNDIDKRYGKNHFDFCYLPLDWLFDVVVFDPPYKLNGTPSEPDERYGVDKPTRWQDRLELMIRGLQECCRVADKRVLVKCQDQVVSSVIRWQTTLLIETAQSQGFRLRDRFDLLGKVRQQPGGRKQKNAHGRPSTLLVLERGWNWRP